MPDLFHSLQGFDLSHLKIIAELWGIEFEAPTAKAGLRVLIPFLLDEELVKGLVKTLPQEANAALEHILRSGGRLPWSDFSRRYGKVREMGAGRRDRERPYDNSSTTSAEALWYRGLIGKAFFDSSVGPIEHVYIPDDLIPFFPAVDYPLQAALGRPATEIERSRQVEVCDLILEDTCTLLAGLRMGFELDQIAPHFISESHDGFHITPMALKQLLLSAGILNSDGYPLPEATRKFLEADRGEALLHLVQAWVYSEFFNELSQLPNIVVEGNWRNEPQLARMEVLKLLSSVPGRQALSGVAGRPWWSLRSFVKAIFQDFPDFQRPNGDYESWLLRDRASGDSLRGFEHWDKVDGELIHFIICGPFHWLGVLDLAYPLSRIDEEHLPVSAFRFSEWSNDLLNDRKPSGLRVEDQQIRVSTRGRITVPLYVPRGVRYQIARFCQWESFQRGNFQYQITVKSLNNAIQNGLRIDQLIALIKRFAKDVPPNLVRALKQWESQGVQITLEKVLVLRLKEPDLLLKLRQSRVGRFLGDPLGPTTVIVKGDATEKVINELLEWGYLTMLEYPKEDTADP